MGSAWGVGMWLYLGLGSQNHMTPRPCGMTMQVPATQSKTSDRAKELPGNDLRGQTVILWDWQGKKRHAFDWAKLRVVLFLGTSWLGLAVHSCELIGVPLGALMVWHLANCALMQLTWSYHQHTRSHTWGC